MFLNDILPPYTSSFTCYIHIELLNILAFTFLSTCVYNSGIKIPVRKFKIPLYNGLKLNFNLKRIVIGSRSIFEP